MGVRIPNPLPDWLRNAPKPPASPAPPPKFREACCPPRTTLDHEARNKYVAESDRLKTLKTLLESGDSDVAKAARSAILEILASRTVDALSKPNPPSAREEDRGY